MPTTHTVPTIIVHPHLTDNPTLINNLPVIQENSSNKLANDPLIIIEEVETVQFIRPITIRLYHL